MQTIIKTYNMELTLKDRVLILNTVLPQFDTRKNMELKVSIDSKIAMFRTIVSLLSDEGA